MFRREIQLSYGLFAMVAGAGLWAFVEPLLEPRPYRAVSVISASVDDGGFHLVANFVKTECVFVRLDVVGTEFGETHRLPWSDNDDLGPSLDREEGKQTLRITADTGGRDFDAIEVRTRHDCEGVKVDRVFMRYEP